MVCHPATYEQLEIWGCMVSLARCLLLGQSWSGSEEGEVKLEFTQELLLPHTAAVFHKGRETEVR